MSAQARTGIVEVYLELHPTHIAFVKFVLESYESVAVVRTIDRKRAVIVLLVVEDFAADADRIIEDLARRVPLRVLPLEPSLRGSGTIPGDEEGD